VGKTKASQSPEIKRNNYLQEN